MGNIKMPRLRRLSLFRRCRLPNSVIAGDGAQWPAFAFLRRPATQKKGWLRTFGKDMGDVVAIDYHRR